jgi:hypothetical protein
MTITMRDVETEQVHEVHIIEGWVRPRSRWLTASHWVDVAVDAVIWGTVLMAASGAGLLLEAIIDTARFGHPR